MCCLSGTVALACVIPSQCLWVLAVFRAMARKARALGPLCTLAQGQRVTHDLLQLGAQPQPHQVLRNLRTYPPLERSAVALLLLG